MDSMKEPTKLTEQQQREILRLMGVHRENKQIAWTAAACVIIFMAGTVATYCGFKALGADMTSWDTFLGLFIIWAMISPVVAGLANALREDMASAKVKKLHNKDVSAQQIAKIHKIAGTDVVKELSKYDSRYIEKLSDGRLDNVPVATAKAIMNGSRKSHPEYNQGIMTELNNILWDYNRAKQVKTK